MYKGFVLIVILLQCIIELDECIFYISVPDKRFLFSNVQYERGLKLTCLMLKLRLWIDRKYHH